MTKSALLMFTVAIALSGCLASKGSDDDAGSCVEAAVCESAVPTCPPGEVPLVSDGCYTGACLAVAACDGAPACNLLNTEADCGARSDCSATFTGTNCRDPQGNVCNPQLGNCTCETFSFASCHAK